MALSDIFAPAYIASDPASVQAVNDWQAKNFFMTNPLVEQTRQPVPFNTGNPAGEVDVEALRALAQGGPYDMQTRRNAIAAQLQANNSGGGGGGGGGAAAGPAMLPGGGLDPNDPANIARYYQLMGMGGAGAGAGGGASAGQQPMSGGPYSGGGPVAAGLAPPQVMLGVS